MSDFVTTSLSVDALAFHATARAVKRAEAGIGKAQRRWTLLARVSSLKDVTLFL